MPPTNNILIWAESRFSISHLKWTMYLAQELRALGFQPILASSTLPKVSNLLQGIEAVALPGWKSERGADRYQSINDIAVLDDTAWQEHRRSILVDTCEAYRPVAIITETWPYAKGPIHDHELLGLMDVVSVPTKCYGLVMDIPLYTAKEIARPAGGSTDAALKLLKSKYSATFSTGDGEISDTAKLITPKTPVISPGYFFDPTTFTRQKQEDIVVVSSGAGYKDEDFDFYVQCMASIASSCYAQSEWYMYISHDCPDEDYAHITQLAQLSQNHTIRVSRNSPDFMEMVSKSRLLITRAGYYTTMPAAYSSIPMLIIPRSSSNEQLKRAELLGQKGIRFVTQDNNFAEALKATLGEELSPAKPVPMKTGGAKNAALHIAQDLKRLT